ncbi:sulfurtransferase [Brumicola nitratireducens]|uniref:Putative thiosulfate sulfurtransferase SseA n=1 Tax=Glaciecola nitratireducens (strain JCM 12485 / KCTC 12276 / FR1064) TaxID=1085623 RepID=G4QGY3_GLANF|nr:sulfurtransferase [Glaciecola nitratireducens]AEP29928.1 putative thiosulfate sulfurtransferase SseA [Glaciecola nitratireducens FR1064]
MISTIISCHDLFKKIESKNTSSIKILFTTMANAPTSKPDLKREDVSLYIPKSLLFDFENDFVNKQNSFSNMMPSLSAFQVSAQKLGLNVDDEIVVYDDFGNFCASRAWFMLLSMGFTNVKTLDGGLPQWIKCGYKTESSLISPNIESNVQLKASLNYSFVDADYICTALSACLLVPASKASTTITLQTGKTNRSQLIDARSFGRYAGIESEPRASMRSGHIPTSVNIHYASLQHAGKFKSSDELTDMFEDNNINLKNEMIISCGSGVTACIVAQAAYSLGAPRVKVYDASWSEWGASQTLPIEVGV